LNFADGIFSHSDEIIDILNKHKVKPKIHKIDLGINTDIFRKKDSHKSNDDPYIFYSLGKWSLANGHDIVIRCFNETFDENDNVSLRLLPHNEFLTEEEENKWFKLIEDSKLKNKITVYNKLNNQYELSDFIADSDCFLSLGRISHSGLTILETISIGKPIIYTDIGMNKQYNIANNTPIIMTNKQAAHDNRLLFGESDWFSFDDQQIDGIKNAMKYNFTNKIRSNTISSDFTDKYSWANTAKAISDAIFLPKNKNTKTKV
jgi:glycosyltransferase involved in cell wall biosynthesis